MNAADRQRRLMPSGHVLAVVCKAFSNEASLREMPDLV